mmetsp:Transcript_10245/g.12227  ORF Transcript_10245/g.12227 Transcript_10245/m.12227 type:complete len:287 (-) Transcript_10245:68-928(-)|eukprot:jgi/Bigna1/89274/estExt_fgenesh1_pg.C_460088
MHTTMTQFLGFVMIISTSMMPSSVSSSAVRTTQNHPFTRYSILGSPARELLSSPPSAFAQRRISMAQSRQLKVHAKESKDDNSNHDGSEAEDIESLKDAFDEGLSYGQNVRKEVLSRFLSPVIDDRGLPLADALVTTSSSLLVAIVVLAADIIRPSWLQPLEWVPTWRSLPYILPAITHGSLLSLCWILGGLAAQGYQKASWESRQAAAAFTAKAWAFAVSMMIIGVQLGLAKEAISHGVLPLLGEDEGLDMLAVSKYSELTVDAIAVGAVMGLWRQYRVGRRIQQ